MLRSLHGGFIPLLLLVLCGSLLPSCTVARKDDDEDSGDQRRLVVFAGPHKTSETSVQQFFQKYAVGSDDASEGNALHGWIWPQVSEDNHLVQDAGIEPYQVFKHLVLNAMNDEVQDELLQIIQDEYNEKADVGIIIGSEEFDRVGQTVSSNTNAIDAVVKVKDRLGISDEYTTIVLLYKLPRIDQWLALFNFEIIEMGTGRTDAYEDFVCDRDYTDARWETLHTAMNTMLVAKAYRSKGWDVQLIDMGGVTDAGLEVEHVIGCEILKGECDEAGFLQGLKDDTFAEDSRIYDSFGNREFKSLSDEQRYDLENLFRYRDCNHVGLKDDEGVTFLHEKTVLLDCDTLDEDLVQALGDGDLMLDAIRSQKNCSSEVMDLHAVLIGEEEVATKKSKSQQQDEKEFKMAEKKHHRRYIIYVFVFLFVALMYRRRSNAYYRRIDRSYDRSYDGKYGGMPFVHEYSRRQQQRERPLSLLT